MSTETRILPLQNFDEVEAALKGGWTVRCRLLEIDLPVGGIELTVDDVREIDEEDQYYGDEFQVLTLQGWRAPTSVWAVKG